MKIREVEKLVANLCSTLNKFKTIIKKGKVLQKNLKSD